MIVYELLNFMRNCMTSSPLILKAAPLVQESCALLKKEGLSLTIPPHLVVIVVGNHEPSWIYVRQKQRMAQELGMRVTIEALSPSTTQSELNALCARWSSDTSCHGILVQLPLPKTISVTEMLTYLDPAKDIDGLTLTSQGALACGDREQGFLPCTPFGVMRLLRYYGISVTSKRVLVIGRSALVGKPMALCALAENATVTIAHSRTHNLKDLAQEHDIIISATGVCGLLSWADTLPGQVVIDVGIHRGPDGKLHGDLGPASTSLTPAAYTPVPGGVGPMTINTLMYNVFMAYFRQTQNPRWSALESQLQNLKFTPL